MTARRRRRRLKGIRLSLATGVEIAGTLLIGLGLALIYRPLALLWFGVAAFGLAYVLELRPTQHVDAGTPRRALRDASDRDVGRIA